jgi:hypothetical protein
VINNERFTEFLPGRNAGEKFCIMPYINKLHITAEKGTKKTSLCSTLAQAGCIFASEIKNDAL